MAESQSPAAAPAAITKPVKPDQDEYNKNLAVAEKEYQDALKQYVSPLPWPLLPDTVESEHASVQDRSWITTHATMPSTDSHQHQHHHGIGITTTTSSALSCCIPITI